MAVPTAWNSDVPGAGELMPDAGRVGDTGRTMPPRMGVNIGVAEEGMPRLTGDWAWWLKGDTGATGWTPPTDTTSKLPSVWKWRWASSVIGGGGGTPGVDDSSTVRSCIGSGGGGRLRFFFFFFFGDDSSVSAATELRRGDVRLPNASWEVSLRKRNHAHTVSNWLAQAAQGQATTQHRTQAHVLEPALLLRSHSPTTAREASLPLGLFDAAEVAGGPNPVEQCGDLLRRLWVRLLEEGLAEAHQRDAAHQL